MKKHKRKGIKIPAQNKALPVAPAHNSGQDVLIIPANGNTDKKLKRAFFISLAFMLIIFWCSGYNVGYHFDEMDMNNYCKDNYAYYASRGKNVSYLSAAVKNVITPTGPREDTLLRYYGSAFDYLAVGFNKVTKLENTRHEFNTRHIFNQLFAVLAILFSGLIAYRASGWRAAIFAQWLLFLTPTFFGHALFNTKDIPFCAGYVASLYFLILFLEEMPSPSWKNPLFLMLSIAFTTGMRIGGMLLIFYLLLFSALYLLFSKAQKESIIKNIWSLLLKLFIIIAGGLCLVIVSWPFLLSDPLHHLPKAMDLVNKFPLKVKFLFEGDYISSLQVPYYFLPKIMCITIPVFILVSFFTSLFFIKNRNIKQRIFVFLLFTSLFPIVYSISKNVAVYTSWRHFTFVYPGIAIITSLGLNEIMRSLQKPILQKIFVLFCIACMLHPIAWSIKNHPFEYAYFNEAEGGFKKAYDNYETDYWTISVKNGLDWLMENEPVAGSKDTIQLICNAYLFADHYLKTNYPGAKVKIVCEGYKNRSSFPWTYGVFANLFFTANDFETEYPPYGLVHTIDIDNLPVTMILKDTTRFDMLGIEAMSQYNWDLADSFFNLYYRNGGQNNKGMLGYMGIIKAMKRDSKAAIALGNRSIEFSNMLYSGFLAVGLAYLSDNKLNEAMPFLKEAYTLTSKSVWITQLFNSINPHLIDAIEGRIKIN